MNQDGRSINIRSQVRFKNLQLTREHVGRKDNKLTESAQQELKVHKKYLRYLKKSAGKVT